jgi:hypothetical protein
MRHEMAPERREGEERDLETKEFKRNEGDGNCGDFHPSQSAAHKSNLLHLADLWEASAVVYLREKRVRGGVRERPC